jgi:hypothetical protein
MGPLANGGHGGALLDPVPRALRGFALDHEDVDGPFVVHPARHHHVEGGQVKLLIGRVDLPLPADQAQPDRADRAVERKPSQHDRQAGGVDAGDVVGIGQVR